MEEAELHLQLLTANHSPGYISRCSVPGVPRVTLPPEPVSLSKCSPLSSELDSLSECSFLSPEPVSPLGCSPEV